MQNTPNILPKNCLQILWALLILTLEVTYEFPLLKYKACNKPEQYSFEISQIDKYLGYIAWTEKAFYKKTYTEIQESQDILSELITQNPNRPEAYVKLWASYYMQAKIPQCIDIAEKLFMEGTEFEGNVNILIGLVVLLFVKSLMRGSNQEIYAYQKLQYQYLIQSDTPMLLYEYGKCIVKTTNKELQKHFLGSALSSFQECIRSCVVVRHAKIYFWMGKVYELRLDLVNALYCYGRAMSEIPQTSAKYRYIQQFINQYKEFQNKANLVAERIFLSRQNKLKQEDPKSASKTLENIKNALSFVEKTDKLYSQYLSILYSYFVDKNNAQTRKLISNFDKNNAVGLYVLLEIWAIESKASTPIHVKTTAKYIYKLLDSFEIPNHLWIKGHILCAKTLIKDKLHPNYSEAIKLLRSLCYVLPPLPLLNNNSIFNIRQDLLPDDPASTVQIDANKQDILDFFEGKGRFGITAEITEQPEEEEEKNKGKSKIGKLETEMNDFYTSSGLNKMPRKFSQQAEDNFDETHNETLRKVKEVVGKSHKRKCSAYMQQLMVQKTSAENQNIGPKSVNDKFSRKIRSFKPSIGYMPKGLLNNLNSENLNAKIEDNPIKYDSELFSVSTQYDYLYLLGKTAIKYNVDVKFGVKTLSDLMGLLGLFLAENTNVGYKARYWIGSGLQKLKKGKEAMIILQKIMDTAGKSEEKIRKKTLELITACQMNLN